MFDFRLCPRGFMSRRQFGRNFNEVHGDVLECGVCRFELPATRKYAMVQHIERKHPGKPIRYNVLRRATFCHPSSPKVSCVDCEKRIISSRRSPRKSVPPEIKRELIPSHNKTPRVSTLPVSASQSQISDCHSNGQLRQSTVPDPHTPL